MMRRFLPVSSLLLALAAAAGCGGKLDEPAGSSAPVPGPNAPQSTTSGDGCERSCDRFAECTQFGEERTSCLDSCRRNFTDPGTARAFATCLEALSCADIERGLSMDYGPIGECYTRALRR